MSGGIARFVAFAVPDAIEAGARMAVNVPDEPRLRRRKPRNPQAMPGLGKQESSMTVNNPSPDEIQAGLDAVLAKFVDAAPTPLKRAETLIKLGQYQVELSKYAPILREADPDLVIETLTDWFAAGDAEMKKALVNAGSGVEDFPLIKMAAAEGPDVELARMLDALPEGAPRAALLQKMGFYATQLEEMTARGTLLKIAPEVIDGAVEEWIAAGDDGSHKALKKALGDVDRMARATAATSSGENELSDQKAGNASTHVSSKLSGMHDHTWGARPPGEGAGARMRGSEGAPGQGDGESPTIGSGPNDTGEGGVSPPVIRRKGTTGGLGSVAGADGGGVDLPDNDPATGKKKKKPAMDKSQDLGLELIKFAPAAMVAALNTLTAEDQAEVCTLAAQDAADLMAWSAQNQGQLQKSVLDSAIADWLQADPDTLALKKWVAEALATAEEIPVSLSNAIAGWQAPAPVVAAVRVRQPYGMAA